jgi:hypothetical protein
MAKRTAGTLSERSAKLSKRLREKGESLAPEKVRELKKRIKRTQRSRRALVAAAARTEARLSKKEKAAEG